MLKLNKILNQALFKDKEEEIAIHTSLLVSSGSGYEKSKIYNNGE